MKLKRVILMLGICVLILTACGRGVVDGGKQSEAEKTPEKIQNQQTEEGDPSVNTDRIDLNMTIGNKVFSVKFYENQTTQTLVELLPMTFDMSELNGNEKFYYLPNKLPTAPEQAGLIRAGDIMLYGDDCLVVFYKSFTSSFKYTRLGYVEDAAGLAQAVGDSTAKVTMELATSE